MNIICTVDILTRHIALPAGVQIASYDHNVDVIQFNIEPIEDFSLDLSSIKIAAQGPNKARHDYAVDPSTVQIEEETGYITFDWPIPAGVTEMPIGTFKYGDRGQLIFAVCAEIISGSTVSKAWHSDDGIITVVAHLEPEAGGGEDPSETATNAQKIAQLQTDVTVMRTQIGALANGSPTPVETKAEMTEETSVYLYVGNEEGESTGYWYSYDSTEEDFVPRGEYGGAVTDPTLSISGRAADAKAVSDAFADKADSSDVTALGTRVTAVEGDIDALESGFEAKVASRYGAEYSPNLVENAESMTSGYLGLNGTHYDASTMAYTDYIPVKAGWVLRAYFVKSGVLTPKDLRFVTCYDSEKTAMASAGATNVASFTVPSGVAYVRVTYTGVSDLVTNYQLSANYVATSYSAYTPISALIEEDFLTIESSDLIEKLKNMTDAYGIALPKTTIRQTVGIAEKWYYASAVTPDSTRCAISAGTQYTSLDDTGITFLNTSAYSSANGYRYLWYDVFLSLIESGVGDAGYGWARRFIAENLSNCSLLCIGDSTVDHDTMTATILSHFAEQGATVTLLGTLGDGSGTNKNEGRAGWKAVDYLTNKTYNGVVNPFYNPTSGTFDFAYYMQNQNYSGVDFVVLQLGINDLYNSDATAIEPTWTAIEEMIDSILAYNSGIKIILNLPTTPGSNQSAHSVPEFLYRNRVIRYNAYAQAQVKAKYLASQVRCSYCHLILDPDTEIRDNVHPTVSGYQKMGLEVCNQINNWQNA